MVEANINLELLQGVNIYIYHVGGGYDRVLEFLWQNISFYFLERI